MEKVGLEKSRTWNECNKEEINIKKCNMESVSWKKCNIKNVQHEKKQPKKGEHKQKHNVEKAWYEKCAIWKE